MADTPTPGEPWTADAVRAVDSVLAPYDMQGLTGDILAAIHEAGWRQVDDETEHVIEFRTDGWTIKHPLSCRPDLFNCPVNRAASYDLDSPPAELGRFPCGINDDGEFVYDASREVDHV